MGISTHSWRRFTVSNVESQVFTPKIITRQAGVRTPAGGMLSGRANHYTTASLNIMDDHLSMASQVSNICRSAYYHLSRIAKIRHSLTTSVCKSLIHGLVTSRLDYGNAMLFGIADRLLHRLEMVQRSAARVVMQIRRGDRQSMTTILQRLHWLPVKKRIEFKILVLVHKAIYEGQPVYLASLLNQHTPKRCLRSSSGLLLDVPRVNLERFGRRAFACAGPTLWNNLPISLRVNGNHTQFKKLLKTYLFST